MAEYKVQFEVFEGPLDLLLYLIKKEEVDIYEVNLTKLATQFIEYIDLMRAFDLEVAGEFLVMASTLMYIKSRELLPADQQVVVEAEDEGEDPRWELIRQLVEYKKFKDAAAKLQTLEERQENVFPRLPGKIEFQSRARAETGGRHLRSAERGQRRPQALSGKDRRRTRDLRGQMDRQRENRVRPQDVHRARHREIFRAVCHRRQPRRSRLHLSRAAGIDPLKQLACVQPEPFAEIEISRAVASAAPARKSTASAPEAEVEAEVKSAPPSPEPTAAVAEEAAAEDEFDDEDDDDEDDDDEEDDDEDDEDGDEDGDEEEAGADDQKPN
jgi:segregation and condensation protein A